MLALATCLVVAAFAPAAVAAPSDTFSSAPEIDISGTRGISNSADLSGATREAGEPTVAGSNTAHTVWFRYTASTTGFAKFSTCRPTGINPVPQLSLGVYTGGSVDALTPVAQGTNNCPSGYENAQVGPFPVTAGSYYWLQIGGANSLSAGETDLALTLDFNTAVPTNDDWASAMDITGALPQTFVADNGLATVETGEPYSDAVNERQTLWWKWTAAADGVISVDTCGSPVDPGQDSVLTVFSGSSPSGFGDLNSIADVDDGCSSSNTVLSKAFVPVASGVTYWIKLSNYSRDYGSQYSLQVKQVTKPDYATPPYLDSYSIKMGNPATGNDASWAGYPDVNTTRQWLRCDVNGANCVNISGATGTVYATSAADLGKTIRFSQTGSNGSGSTFAQSDPTLPIEDTPANDNWVNATNLGTGSTITKTDDNLWATSEIGEPAIGAFAARNSVWYRWTPAVGGNYIINNCLGGNTLPDPLDLMIGIRSGAGPGVAQTDAEGAGDDGCGPFHPYRTAVDFTATAGKTYWIQVASKVSGLMGSFDLNIAPAGNPVVTAQPTLTGAAEINQELTLNPGDWIGPITSTVTYWYKCDAAGSGCVQVQSGGSNFVIPTNYGGSTVKAQVQINSIYGSTTSEVLSAVIPADSDGDGVPDASDACVTEAGNKPNGCPASVLQPNTAPTVSGTYIAGQTLTSSTPVWDVLHDQLSYTVDYQWQRCTTTSAASCVDISGATGQTYVLTAGDLTSYIRVAAMATNTDDQDTQFSTIDGPVASPPSPPQNTSPPTVTGTPIVGLTLNSANGTWTPAGVAFTYKWLRCTDNASLATCSPIGGATASSYTLVSGDLGKYIRVEVTGANVVDSDVGTSGATAIVTGDSDGDGVADVYDTCPSDAGDGRPNGCPPSVITPTGAPTITGTLEVGMTVNSSQGSWLPSGDPIGYTVDFQWQRCDTAVGGCSDISGATSDTYVLAQADYAKHMRVRATAHNSDDSETQDSLISGAIGQTPGAISPPVVSGITMDSETLSTTTGIWVPFDTAFGYEWLRCTDNVSPSSCATIPSATDPTYVLTSADIGSYIRSRVTGTNGTGSDFARSAPTAQVTADTDADNDGVDDVNDNCPAVYGTKPNGCPPSNVAANTPPIISGTLLVGQDLTTDNGTWDVTGEQLALSYAYQWQRCDTALPASCSDIGGATAGTYTLAAADYGKYLRVHVTAGNADDSDSQYSDVDGPVSQVPSNITPPTVSGTALTSATLSGTQGTWTPADATLANEWLRCDDATLGSCSVIAGETGATYSAGAADSGKYLRLRVTGTAAGSVIATSAPLGPIRPDADSDGVADDGDDVCLNENGSKPNGCDPSVVVADAPPIITGILEVGQMLVANSGDWHADHDPLPLSYSYQWERCDTAVGGCSDISGETDSDYLLVAADYGKFIRVTVTASNADDSGQQSSSIVGVVSQFPINTATPGASGSIVEGYTLTADQGSWLPGDATLDNTWLRCDDTIITSCTPIPGETGATYVLSAADVTKYIRVRVTASTIAGANYVDSPPVGQIQPDGDGDGLADGSDTCPLEAGAKPNGCPPSVVVPVAPPTVTGTLEVGQTLTTDNGTWTTDGDPLPLSYSRQWQRCDTSIGSCSDIPGATGSNHILTAADYGKYIRAAVTASNADDSDTQYSSISASAVSQFPTNSAAPSVTGTATVGKTLTGDQGTWQPGDATLTNSWLRCDDATLGSCSPIGAAGTTYALAPADEGKYIRLQVSALTAAGNDDATSAATAAVIVDADDDGVADGVDACLGETGTKPNGCLPSDLAPSTAPNLSGTFEIPQVITTDHGTFSMVHDQLPITYNYKWQVCTSALPSGCSYLPGETGSSLTLTSSLYGKYVRSEVTAVNDDDSATQFSDPSPQLWEPPVNSAPPTITGVYGIGETLTAHSGTWTPAGASLSFTWLRCDDPTPGSCTALPSETGSTYLLTSADLHKFIRVRETATTPLDSLDADSAPTIEILADSDGDGVDDVDDTCPSEPGSRANGCDPSVLVGDAIPVISGDLTVGQQLHTTDGHWQILHDPIAYAVGYQWQSCTDPVDDLTCSDVSGATGSNYTLAPGDYGTYFRVITTADNGDDTDSQASTITAMVTDVPSYSTAPSITGQPRVSAELSGDRGIWTPPDASFDYEWLRCSDNVSTASCAAIPGETATTYTLAPADDGSYIRFRVIAQTSSTVVAESDATAAVYTDSDDDNVVDSADACPTDAGDGRPNGCPPSVLTNIADPVLSGNLVIGDTVHTSDGLWGEQGDQLGYGFTYQWQLCDDATIASCSDIAGAQSADYTPVSGQFGKRLRALVTAGNSDDTKTQPSQISAPLDEKPYLITQPTISGSAAVGDTLTGDDGTYGPGNVMTSRVWLRCDDALMTNCAPIGGATGSSYTLVAADYNQFIVLRVFTSNSADVLFSFSSPTAQIGAGALDSDGDNVLNASDTCPTEAGDGRPNGCPPSVLVNDTLPSIGGTPEVGQTLTAVAGTWHPIHDPLAYTTTLQWQRCDTASPASCTDIPSENGSTYALTPADYAKYVRLVETASNADDNDPQGSSPLGAVGQAPSNSVAPSISGTEYIGQTLTANQGTWAPFDVSLSNAWMRCTTTSFASCTPIPGEVGSTYTLTASDDGMYIRVNVSGQTSVTTLAVASAPTGQVTADPGPDTDNDGVYDSSDACVNEAGTKPNGCLPSVLVSNTLPSVGGTMNVGQTLTASVGTWDVLHDQLGYTTARQWQRCDTTSTASCSDIGGETGATYVLAAGDYGKHIRLQVTATNTDDADTQNSTIGAVVSQVPANSVAPSLSGTTTDGQTLTASQGTWTPVDATLSNTWLRCNDATLGSCSTIGGEIGSTYLLTSTDIGKYVRVRVSAMTSAGTTVLESAPSGPIAAIDSDSDGVPDSSDTCASEAGTKPNGCLPSVIVNTALPTISGTLRDGAVLSSTAGSWNVLHDPLGYTTTRQWQRCDDQTTASCSDIAAATGVNYTATPADIGKYMRVVVTATNPDDTQVQASAITATAVVIAPPPVNQTPPDISGTAQVGQLLSTDGGTWTPNYAVLTYEWLRCDDTTTGSCVVITGFTSAGYQLSSADLGKFIRVRVTGTVNAQTAIALSNPTNQVTEAPAGPTGPGTTPSGPVNPAQILGPQKKRVITVRMNKKGQIYISRVSVYCMMESTGDCSGSVALKARLSGRTRTIGGFKLNTLRGGGRTLRIKLSSAAQRYVRAHSVLRSSLKVTYKSPGVSTSRYSATVKIKG